MHVTIKSPNRGIILYARRVGLSCGLLVVESNSLLCEILLKPASLELEVRVPERAALVASGRFRIDLPEDCILAIQSREQRVDIEIAGSGFGKFSILSEMAWIEAIPA